jgi:hypothetical protein
MTYVLKKKFVFNGVHYPKFTMPEIEVRHEMANIRIAKMFAELRKEKHKLEDMLPDELELPSEAMIRFRETEIAAQRLLLETFWEELPPEAIDRLPLEDHRAICDLISKALKGPEDKQEAPAPEKKSSRPKRSA